MKKSTKEKRNQELLEMLKTHSLGDVASHFEISRQRVFQIAERYGADLKSREVGKGSVSRIIKKSGLLGKMSDREISKVLEVSENYVGRVRKDMNIPKVPRILKEIGCGKCKIKPYSKGLCKACYIRQWRRGR